MRDPREAQFAQQNLISPNHIKQQYSTEKRHKLMEEFNSMDIKLIQAIQQPNSQFRIKQFLMKPLSDVIRGSSKKVRDSIKSQNIQFEEERDGDDDVKVESMGMTSADQPFPSYAAYFPRMVYTQDGEGEESTLILEPNSKAVSGNDGISISTPLSHALLRKGVPVRVLFKPESVAISGAGGTSHAQADLILDFIDE